MGESTKNLAGGAEVDTEVHPNYVSKYKLGKMT